MNPLAIQITLNSAANGAAYALIALSFGVIYRAAGFLHFAYGGVYAWGAYALYVLYVGLHWPLLCGFCGSVVIAGALGGLLDAFVYRNLRRRAASPFAFLLASLGVFTILQNGLPLIFGDSTLSLHRAVSRDGFDLFGARLSYPQAAMIVLALVLYPLVWYIIQRTSIGRKFRAVEVDRELAELSAVPTVKVVTATFIVGSALSAIPAGLTALDIDLTPIMGFPAILVGLVSIIVGGTESIVGCALSGFLVGVLQNVAAYLVGSRWQNSAVYLTLLLVLLCRPLGLLGRASTRLVSQK